MYYVEFANVLKRLRTEKKLTQTELGRRTGLNKAVISKYENAASYPPYNVLILFAQTFRVSIDYLLGIEKVKAIDTCGLTDSQIESVLTIIEEFRTANKSKNIT